MTFAADCYVSCCFLARVPDSRVVAIEPLPACYALLESNLARFPGRGVALQVAVSDSPGIAHLVVNARNLGGSHLEETAGNGECVLCVETYTPTRCLEATSTTRVNLIKVDVEGHEIRVVPALHDVLVSHRPRAVVFEHHATLEAGSPVAHTLSSTGYEIFAIVTHLTRYELRRAFACAVPTRVSDYVAVYHKEMPRFGLS